MREASVKIWVATTIFVFFLSNLTPSQIKSGGRNFNFEDSLAWTPFYPAKLDIILKLNNERMALIGLTFVDQDDIRIYDQPIRIVDLIVGPYSQTELDAITKQVGKIGPDTDVRKLYRITNNKSLFVIEVITTGLRGGAAAINLYRRGVKPYEFWRFWQPHWIFVADLKDLAPEQQRRFMEEKFGIIGWIDY